MLHGYDILASFFAGKCIDIYSIITWSIWGVLIFHRPFGSGSYQSSTRISCVVVLDIEGSFYHLCCAVSHRDIDSMENATTLTKKSEVGTLMWCYQP